MDEWKQAVVRVWHGTPHQGGAFVGTAFLIAPEYLVTAGHVVNGRLYGELWLQGPPWSGLRGVAQIECHDTLDVALIQLKKATETAKMIPLATVGEASLSQGDRVILAGYSPSSPGADVEVFEVEISTYDGVYDLEVAHSSIARGMSGGPVLKDGRLVGIISGRHQDENKTYVLGLNAFRALIESVAATILGGNVSFMVEALPEDFVQRPKEYGQVVNHLLNHQGTAVAMTAALRGAGGFGKTTLARAICWEPQVRDTFSDGIIWVTLGESPGDVTGKVSDIIEAITGERPGFQDVGMAAARLNEVLDNRKLLLVIDDVWDSAHVRPFLQGGPQCARLMTTRNSATLPQDAYKVNVDAMQASEAMELLCVGLAPIPPESHAAIRELAITRLGEWPLLLKLVNSVLREQMEMGDSWAEALGYVIAGLDEEGLTAFDMHDTEDRTRAVAHTIALSLKHLTPDELHLYQQLAIFPEDVSIPLATLTKLWKAGSGFKVKKLCQRFWKLSLLQEYNARQGIIRLHDVMRMYVIQQHTPATLQALHHAFLASYTLDTWTDLPQDDVYLWRHVAYHLIAADQTNILSRLLLDYAWVWSKLQATDVNALLADYTLALSSPECSEDEQALRLIHGALRLSAHILARDPAQLPSQLHGRLCAQTSSGITHLLDQARGKSLWLRPITCSFTPPGGALVRTLRGHTDGVTAVAVTPDGTQVVSASGDTTLKVWDLTSGVLVRSLRGHTGVVWAVAVTPDGTQVISASNDTTLKVWELTSGAEVWTLRGHTDRVMAVAVTPDGTQVISASNDTTLKVWDMTSGTLVRSLRGHTDGVTAVAVTPDGTQVVSASGDTTLKVWDVTSGAEVQSLCGHTGGVMAVAVTPNGKQVVSVSKDHTLKVWDLASGTEVRTLHGHTDSIRAVAVAPDGTQVVSASNDNTLKVWDLASGAEARTLRGHSGWIYAVAVTPDGTQVISASYDHTLKVWDVTNDVEVRSLREHTGGVMAVAVMPDGTHVVSASRDNTLKVWDVTNDVEVRTFSGHPGWVTAMAVTPDGTQMVSVSIFNTLMVWGVTSGAKVRTFSGPPGRVTAVAVTPDGTQVISASFFDHTLKVWDVTSGAEMRTLRGHTGVVWAMAVTPDGTQVVSASNDHTLKVWDVTSGAEVRTLLGHTGGVMAVAVTPDGTQVVSASNDHTLKVWDVTSGAEVRTLSGHTNRVTAVAVTPDGTQVVSASKDHLLKVWNLSSGNLLTTFSADAPLECCAVAPDGLTIVAGDSLGNVHFLRVEGE